MYDLQLQYLFKVRSPLGHACKGHGGLILQGCYGLVSEGHCALRTGCLMATCTLALGDMAYHPIIIIQLHSISMCLFVVSLQLKVAQSELSLYLGKAQSADNKLNETKKNLQTTVTTLDQRTTLATTSNLPLLACRTFICEVVVGDGSIKKQSDLFRRYLSHPQLQFVDPPIFLLLLKISPLKEDTAC